MTRNIQNLGRFVRTTLAMAALFVAMIALSCDKDSNDSYGNNDGSGNPGANEVWMRGSAFEPGNRTVSEGTTITWTNKDGTSHTVTGNGWGSNNIGQNATFSHTFGTAGSFPYHCSIHSGMTGTITVQ